MSEVKRVMKWFGSGRLVRPKADEINFMDLVHALLKFGGVDSPKAGKNREVVAEMMGGTEHLVFVLVDGLGMNMLAQSPAGGFLRSNLRGQLQAVFPSTTATALTSLATGRWPGENGVPGWWAYVEELDISVVTLPFVVRGTERSLVELGMKAEDLFPVGSAWERAECDVLWLLPQRIEESVYSRYAAGNATRAGYETLSEASRKGREHVDGRCGRTLTYVYIPSVDSAAHEFGPSHEKVSEAVELVERELQELAGALAGKARIVVSADHGLTEVGRRFLLKGDDELSQHLRAIPSGEPRTPVFHVKEGQEKEFEKEFAERFGSEFALLPVNDVEDLRLMGPGGMTEATKRRMGTHVAIAGGNAILCMEPSGGSAAHEGFHAGLMAEEMLVPLIIV